MKSSRALLAILDAAYSAAFGFAARFGDHSPTGGEARAADRPSSGAAADQRASAAAEAVFPEHLLRFDVQCVTQSRISDVGIPGDEAAADDGREAVWRESIDLDRMLSCPSGCSQGPLAIAAAELGIITIEHRQGGQTRIRRRDGAFSHWREQEGEFFMTAGTCRPLPYTAFPSQTPPSGPLDSSPVAQSLELPRLPGSDKPAPPRSVSIWSATCATGRSSIVIGPWAMPYPCERNSDYQRRYVFDLPGRRYCVAETCERDGLSTIVSWNQSVIVLEDDFVCGGTAGGDWSHAVIDRQEATYDARVTAGDGMFVRRTGLCRYEPFSGFPVSG